MLILRRELFEEILRHGLKELPNEACGILAGKDEEVAKIYEMINIDKSPESFFMDSKEQLKVMKDIRNSGLEMIGIYHSHVASEAYPSNEDVKLAFYPEVSCAIITIKDKKHPCLRSFKIREGQIEEEEVKIE